jgi:hypothetical protein
MRRNHSITPGPALMPRHLNQEPQMPNPTIDTAQADPEDLPPVAQDQAAAEERAITIPNPLPPALVALSGETLDLIASKPTATIPSSPVRP